MFTDLLSGFLGGGMSNSSSAAQSTPFYNESGIYFNSPDAGRITAGDVGTTATAAGSRQTAGGLSPQSATSMLDGLSPGISSNTSTILLIAGGAVALIATLYFVLRK